jgi:hypothetical protein
MHTSTLPKRRLLTLALVATPMAVLRLEAPPTLLPAPAATAADHKDRRCDDGPVRIARAAMA